MTETKIVRKTAVIVCGSQVTTFPFDKPSDFLEEIPLFMRDYDDYGDPCELIVIEERDCKPSYREHIFPFDGAMELVEFARGIQFQLHYVDDYEMPTVDWDMLGCGEEDSVQKDNTIERNKAMLRRAMNLLSRLDDSNGLLEAEVVQDEPDTVGLKFSSGTVTLFDDGTWSLDE